MLKGIDINSDNWVSDWNKVKNAGIQVVINKATEGIYYKDKYLPYRVSTCKELGINIGVYHFAGHQDVTAEVNAFISYTEDYDLDTIFWLDIEQPPGSYSWVWSGNDPANFVNAFINLFKQKTSKEIGVYTNKYFYETFLEGKIDSSLKLWIANFGVSTNPYPQSSWQYSETGLVDGVDGYVDMDLFAEEILVTGEGDGKVDSIVIYNYGPDMHSAEILADYLKCPTISNGRSFDYSVVKNVYAVGGTKDQYTSRLTKLISGQDRYATCQAVLDFIKNGGNKIEDKSLNMTDVEEVRKNISDVEVYGDEDTFALLHKASSEKQGWMKSTKICNVPGGCIVQCATQQKNPDGSYAVAEAVTFAPNVQLDKESNPRKLVVIK
ncbi:GH25 family lysozyme [Clostridium sp. WILCCON 0269]|uniref:GH25 family lysozyme n=1 Tax=Candidatus Clostridium eludens TaxID=3381663 RepID=A0ABW8SRG8_9CLOT